ncbi:MAG: hypothetical protein EBS05_05265 [Proteobacteria bacterium]|nr:hypothetical protein [Pseudomonadota bacterium]
MIAAPRTGLIEMPSCARRVSVLELGVWSFLGTWHLGFGVLAVAVFLTLSNPLLAQLPGPRLQSVFPLGCKQGSSVEVEIAGGNLEETRKLYFSHAGITAEPLPEVKDKPARFKVTVAASVPVGEFDVRAIGKHGISNPRTFVVSDFDEFTEKEPNNQRAEANRITLNTTINGRVSPAEDVDWFVFAAKRGQRVLLECKAWRLDSRLDGFLWLFDANGKQLAASQDEAIRNEKRDPFIDIDIPEDGDYYVKFTDFTYSGSGDHFYRLSAGTMPYIDFISPLGARPGSNAPITVYGRNLPGGKPSEFTVKGRPLQKIGLPAPLADLPLTGTTLNFSEVVRPSTSPLNGVEVRLKNEAGSSNAKLLLASGLKELLEIEPNNSTNQAQRIVPPCAVSGRFDPIKDADYFVVAAKKNEKFTVRVLSERLASPADPDLEVLKPDGSLLNSASDWGENIGQLRFTSNTRDIQHTFTAPADGDYYLRLEHVYAQGQGGAQYYYRLEVESEPMPDFRLVCQPPHDIRMDSHVVRQGGRERLDILVWRLDGHNDPITVTATKLPPGVKVEPIVIGPGVKWASLIITADATAPINEGEIEVVGTSEAVGRKLVRIARGGVIVWDTVNTPAISRMTRSLVLAVREKSPFELTASPAEFTVKKGTPLKLNVTIKRDATMPNAVDLSGAGVQMPPGLDIPLTKVAAGKTSAELTLSTDNMPPGTFSFVINGDGQVPTTEGDKQNIRCVYPSNAVKVTIEPVTKP